MLVQIKTKRIKIIYIFYNCFILNTVDKKNNVFLLKMIHDFKMVVILIVENIF